MKNKLYSVLFFVAGILWYVECKATTIEEGSFYTKVYKNLFKEYLGISDRETNKKISDIWNHFFVNPTTKVYFEDSDTTAYILDTGNNDVHTEGMSYGMMISVQMDRRTEFDRIWRWVKKNMHYKSGKWQGYFAWQCNTDGSKIGVEPSCATDGEVYFITSLFFASHRWGNNGEINYEKEGQQILYDIMSKGDKGEIRNMFNTDSFLITFVPKGEMWNFTDPSYNLPAFFELWALWSNSNKDFLAKTPDAARKLLVKASHPITGLFPDYSCFDGTPHQPDWKEDYDARRYQYDAIRCAMNVGMDYYMFGKDKTNQSDMMERLLSFFESDDFKHGQFDLNGNNPTGEYSSGMAGANAVGAFALKNKALAKKYVSDLWKQEFPIGKYRYYSGMVYMLSMLHVSGNFRIY